jgi:hypothetical protein
MNNYFFFATFLARVNLNHWLNYQVMYKVHTKNISVNVGFLFFFSLSMSIKLVNLTAELKVLTLYRIKFFSTGRCNYCIVCHNGLNHIIIFLHLLQQCENKKAGLQWPRELSRYYLAEPSWFQVPTLPNFMFREFQLVD